MMMMMMTAKNPPVSDNRAPPNSARAPGEHDAGRSRVARRLFWMTVAYFSLAVVWLFVFRALAISRAPAEEAAAGNLAALKWYWLASAALWGILTAIFLQLRKSDRQVSKITFRRLTGFIVVSAIILRVVVALTHQPGLSDDIWRYLFDGAVMASGNNPYQIAPAEVTLETQRFAGELELANRLNNRELVTIYLPVSQLVFLVSAKIHAWTDSSPPPTTTMASRSKSLDRATVILRIVLIGFELGILILLATLLYTTGKHPYFLTLYAWHPLVLTEFAGEGHQDVIGIFLLLAALTVWYFRKQSVVRWTALLALSALVKPVTIPVAGFALLHGRANWKTITTSLLVGAGIVFGLLCPFLYYPDSSAATGFFATLDTFLHKWAFQGSIYLPLLSYTEDVEDARRICLAILGLIGVVLLIRRTDPFKAARIFLFAGLLLSPSAWAWYLLWALVLLPLRPSPALWVASLTLMWSYAGLGRVPYWDTPTWLTWATYAPIYLTLLADLVWNFWRMRKRGSSTQ